jgi:hypothetical protein
MIGEDAQQPFVVALAAAGSALRVGTIVAQISYRRSDERAPRQAAEGLADEK